LAESDWIKRAKDWNSESRAGFLAIDKSSPCGLVGSFLEEDDPARANLISMWTARFQIQTSAADVVDLRERVRRARWPSYKRALRQGNVAHCDSRIAFEFQPT